MGLVNSIRQPGGNVTGFWFGDEALIGKRIELLKEVLPRTTHVGLLVNPDDPADTEALQGSNMNSLGVAVRVIPVRSADELENAFATATREGLQGLEVTLAPLFIDHRAELAGLEMRHRLPTIYGVRENAVAGGLMSYGASLTDLYRRKAELVDKILRGARPADLPIERPIKFEFVLNLKTAKALGLDLPVSMQLLADQVIE
jgi:putative ABC transport system substrate-binding protein